MSHIYYVDKKLSIKSFNMQETIGLLTIALAVLWPPLNLWYLHIDSAGRLVFLLFIVSFTLLFRDFRKYALKMPVTIYVAVALYMWINGLLKGSASMYEKDGMYLMFIHIFEPVVTMFITILLARRNLDRTLKWISYILMAYCLLCLINSGYDERGRLNGDINANEMALCGAIECGILMLQYYRGKRGHRVLYVLLSTIPLYVIFQTGSRMSLGMVAIMMFVLWLSHINFRNFSELIRVFVIGICLFCSGMFILDHTMIGERLQETTKKGEEMAIATGTIFDKFGDRGFQYYYSWPYFLKNPMTGIGFHQWRSYSPTGHVCHSEYMVQYVECGLIAFIPYICFLFLMLKGIFRRRRTVHKERDVKTYYLLMAMLLSIIYSNTVLWSYSIHPVFVVYGLVFAFSRYEKQ